MLSAAAGLFVDPRPGPVLANYGLENLRFTKPVKPGDTIQAKLTVKKKIWKERKEDETPNGGVEWHVEVTDQEDEIVATYDILTLVERREEAELLWIAEADVQLSSSHPAVLRLGRPTERRSEISH